LPGSPLFLPLAAYMAGIYSAGSLGLQLYSWLPAFLFVPFLASLAKGRRTIAVCSILVMVFCLGNRALNPLLSSQAEFLSSIKLYSDSKVQLEGLVKDRPEPYGDGCRLNIQIVSAISAGNVVPLAGMLQLKVKQGIPKLLTGDRVRFIAKINEPRLLGLPGEFDYPSYLKFKGIAATSFVKSSTDVLLLPGTDGFLFKRWLDRHAALISSYILETVPGVEGGILEALLVGNTGHIPQDIKDEYSRTGVNHILSISGFHVGIIALFLVQIIIAISRLFPVVLLHLNFRRCAQLLAMPVVVYYLLLSGAAPATVRSVLMLAVYLVALFLEREQNPVNSLVLAALAILAVLPSAMYDLSFQFSFLALWGIVVLTPLVLDYQCEASHMLFRNIALFFTVSLAAILATLLPVAYYFHQISITGLISNFIIVPLLGYGAVVVGFIGVALLPVLPIVSMFSLKFCGFLATISNHVVHQLDRIPVVPVYGISSLEIWFFIFAMVAITFVSRPGGKLLIFSIAVIISIGTYQLHGVRRTSGFRVDFLSIGQGDSALVSFDNGKTMLIDGGGALWESGFDVGDKLLLPALRTMGITRIDYMVLSHPHPDHIKGLVAVGANLPVGEFWESGKGEGIDDYDQLKTVLAEHKVPVYTVGSVTAPINIGKAVVSFLAPDLHSGSDSYVGDDDLNETSLVFRIDYGRTSVLFTGDIGVPAELGLLEHPAPLKSTVLKVPHHGSRHSALPEFFAAVSPQYAVISAGWKNSFHLPASDTLTELGTVGAVTYRTDLDGTVTMVQDSPDAPPVLTAVNRHFH